MRFDTTVEELGAYLLTPGEATFLVEDAVDDESKKDKTEQIKMNVLLTDAHGKSTKQYVYLSPKYIVFIKDFCEAAGISEVFEEGSLIAAQCVGKSGRCVIAVEKGKQKPNSFEFYSDKMAIKKFISRNAKVSASNVPAAHTEAPFLDDDVPF